jgi:hypothetical protein
MSGEGFESCKCEKSISAKEQHFTGVSATTGMSDFFLWNVVLFAMRQEMRAERVRLMVEFFGTAGANSPE